MNIQPIRLFSDEDDDTIQRPLQNNDSEITLPDIKEECANEKEELDIDDIDMDLEKLEEEQNICENKSNSLFGQINPIKSSSMNSLLNPIYIVMGLSLVKYLI